MCGDANEICLDWKYAGKLSEFDKNHPEFKKNSETKDNKGVYMFVYENGTAPKRIIYVGTTEKTFKSRMKEHIKLFNIGARTMFNTNKDIYDLMSFKNYTTKEKYFEFVKNSIEIWVPGKVGNVVNEVNQKLFENHFRLNFTLKDFQTQSQKTYQDKISVWVAEVSIECNYIFIESKIQKCIKQAFQIGYCENKSNQSWLGQETKDEEVNKYKLKFISLPQVDNETLIVLLNNFVL